MPSLVEHLRARLGTQALYGIRRVAEHRPERAWCVAEPAIDDTAVNPPTPGAMPRPTWLLAAPQPLQALRGRPRHHGRLELLRGPERIESGWWDGGDARRDYYVVQTREGQRAWAFLAAGASDGWMLHGWFA